LEDNEFFTIVYISTLHHTIQIGRMQSVQVAEFLGGITKQVTPLHCGGNVSFVG
jgi:hypothetical protein